VADDSLLTRVPYYELGRLATATITTIETWLVRAKRAAGSPGRVLLAETDARHTIWLDRTPTILCLAGHCLHKWVVVQIR
jgi:hypothetical protein